MGGLLMAVGASSAMVTIGGLLRGDDFGRAPAGLRSPRGDDWGREPGWLGARLLFRGDDLGRAPAAPLPPVRLGLGLGLGLGMGIGLGLGMGLGLGLGIGLGRRWYVYVLSSTVPHCTVATLSLHAHHSLLTSYR